MDPVQELIGGVVQADVEGGRRCTQTSLLSSSAALDVSSSCASAAPPQRTKMVFLYSDDDDDGGVEGREEVRPDSGVAEVPCDDRAIAVSADALAELQAEAMAAVGTSDGQTSLLSANGDAYGFSFDEDVVSGLADGASAPTAPVKGMRVREVAAPRLWEGAVAVAASSGLRGSGAEDPLTTTDETHPFLRRGLPAASFVLHSRRKRFREMPASDGDTAQSSAKNAAAATAAGESAPESSAAAAGSSLDDLHSFADLLPAHPQGGQNGDGSLLSDASDSLESAVEEELDVYPVYADDGQTVRALRTRGGYELTLDEHDLLEGVAEGEEEDARDGGAEQGECASAAEAEEEKAADGGDHDAHVDDALSATRAGQLARPAAAAGEVGDGAAGANDWGDFADFDEDEDEEEAELDEAIIVAVVEQLVCCCEADDLDPQMGVEAARFIGTAKPLLEQLTNEVISPAEFVQRIDRDLRRFQRIYKSVYRPRDLPIVIDGVTTDL